MASSSKSSQFSSVIVSLVNLELYSARQGRYLNQTGGGDQTDLEPDDCIENGVFSGHSTMVESDYDLAIEDTDRIHGRTALVNNVRAASSLAGAIRSTLGPKGLDKMLVDADGSIGDQRRGNCSGDSQCRASHG